MGLWVCARQEETAASDVDLLVKFSLSASWRDDLALATACGEVIGRRVDIVRNAAVMNDPYFAAQVCPEAVRLANWESINGESGTYFKIEA